MKDKNILVLIFAMGFMLTYQNVVNGSLASNIGVLESSCIIHLIGMIPSFILFVMYDRKKAHNWKRVFKEKPYSFCGGFIGVIMVALISILVLKIGAFLTAISLIAGQFILSYIIDTKGLFGFKKIKITFRKKMSLVMLIMGVAIMSL